MNGETDNSNRLSEAADAAVGLVTENGSPAPVSRASSIPAWFPSWATEIADLFFAGNTCMFVVHGNVNDLIYCPADSTVPGQRRQKNFSGLADFLSQQLFGSWDVILSYDLGRGIQVESGGDANRHQSMMQFLSSVLGSPSGWSRDPDQVLGQLDRIIQRNLLEDDPAKRKRIAFLFPYAQYLVPAGDHATMARGPASRLVRMLSWAQNPYIKRVNMAFFLVAETLSEVHGRLVQSPHVGGIEIPLPDESARRKFVEVASNDRSASADVKDEAAERWLGGSDLPETKPAATPSSADSATDPSPDSLSVETITRISNGLSLVNLNLAISRELSRGQSVDINRFRALKKTLIERQCADLVTFLEPPYSLDTVVGHVAAKQRLAEDARFISRGSLSAAPMGYLICGPVGTGKTFLAECYAGSIGIPCLELRNFRSKYVGETEANLEKVLNVLRSLGPVVVIIDEADAALGNRESGGDSGTSNRVFSMIATQMGNTRYRGKIIWMLLTSRPELLPIDLKRQGRAEVHIPLFYPQTAEEIADMFMALARKNKIELVADALPDVSPERNLSGADIESILLGAKREMMAAERLQVTADDLQFALDTFIPSAQGAAKELQEIAAVMECTDRRFLNEKWKSVLDQPDGRTQLQQRMSDLQMLVGK